MKIWEERREEKLESGCKMNKYINLFLKKKNENMTVLKN